MKIITGIAAAVLATIMVTMVFTPVVDAEYRSDDEGAITEDTDFALTTALVFLVIGLAAGGLAGYALGNVSSPQGGADKDLADRQVRTFEASNIINNFNSIGGVVTPIMAADTDLWAFTQSYWSRAAELSACELWDGSNYNETAVIDVSGLRATAANYLYTYQSAIDAGFYQLADNNRAERYGSISAYDNGSFDYGFVYDSVEKNYITATKTSESRLFIDLCSMVINPQEDKLVWIDTDLEGVDETSGNVYVFGQNGFIKNRDTGVKYTPTDGVIDTQSYGGKKIPAGYYHLGKGCTYAGNFTSAGSTSPDIVGSVVFVRDGTHGFVRADGNTLYVNDGNSVQTATDFAYYVDYDGTDSDNNKVNDIIMTSSLKNLIFRWNDMVTKINSVITTTGDDGKVMWETLTSIGGTDRSDKSYTMLSPSSVVLPNSNVTLTSEQKRMMFTLALEQVAGFYDGTKSSLNQDVHVSADSLQLVCYGDILYNGKILVKNAVFTPVSCLRNQTLVTDSIVEWNGNGAAMIWGTTDNFSSFNTSSLSNGKLISLVSNGTGEKYTMDIVKIVNDGCSVDEFTLKVDKMSKIFTSMDGWNDPQMPMEVTSMSDIVKILSIVVGIIFLVAGLYTRNRIAIMIGALTIFIGYLFAGVVSDMVFGVKSLIDALNPFGHLF